MVKVQWARHTPEEATWEVESGVNHAQSKPASIPFRYVIYSNYANIIYLGGEL